MHQLEGPRSVAALRRAGSYREALAVATGLERADLLLAAGRLEEAEELLAELDLAAGTPLLVRALRLQGDLRRASLAAVLVQEPSVAGLVDLALLELDRLDLDRAEGLLRRARSALGDPHEEVGLLAAEGVLARLQRRSGAAEDQLTRALALSVQLFGPRSLERAAVLDALADVAGDDGRPHESASLRREATELRRQAFEE